MHASPAMQSQPPPSLPSSSSAWWRDPVTRRPPASLSHLLSLGISSYRSTTLPSPFPLCPSYCCCCCLFGVKGAADCHHPPPSSPQAEEERSNQECAFFVPQLIFLHACIRAGGGRGELLLSHPQNTNRWSKNLPHHLSCRITAMEVHKPETDGTTAPGRNEDDEEEEASSSLPHQGQRVLPVLAIPTGLLPRSLRGPQGQGRGEEEKRVRPVSLPVGAAFPRSHHHQK